MKTLGNNSIFSLGFTYRYVSVLVYSDPFDTPTINEHASDVTGNAVNKSCHKYLDLVLYLQSSLIDTNAHAKIFFFDMCFFKPASVSCWPEIAFDTVDNKNFV